MQKGGEVMPVIDVATAKLRTEASQLNQVAQQFSQSINQIYEARDELGNGWKGSDAEKYKAKLDSFREPLTSLQKSFVAYSEFISESASAYDEQQQNIASAI